MSGAAYRRATKNHAVRVDHTDGSVTNGFVPVPMGMDFVGTMMQAQHFMHFETDSGELTLMNVASIKRITSLESEEENAKKAQSKADKARAEREAENARKRAEEEAARKGDFSGLQKTRQTLSPRSPSRAWRFAEENRICSRPSC